MRLAISQVVVLPSEFDLHIPKKNEVHRVRMRWRSADEVGRRLCRASDGRFAPVPRAETPAARLDVIDAEIARSKMRSLHSSRSATGCEPP
jgi:hypothetical protein